MEPLSTKQLDRVFQRTVEHSFREGESVYLPGDASEMVFLLLAGRVRLYGMVRERELTFDIVRAGSMFGEASLTERTQNEYAQALEPSQVGLLELNTLWAATNRIRFVSLSTTSLPPTTQRRAADANAI